MEQENTRDTLRETIEGAVELHLPSEGNPPATAPTTDAPQADAAPTDKPAGRTTGRPRDEQGRLLPGKPEKNAAASALKADTPQSDTGTPSAAAAPKREPLRIRDRDIEWWQYPNTWKQDHKSHWDTLPDPVRQEIHRREQDAAFGVSTYKAEYDQVKPIKEVLAQYEPFLRQANMRPEQYVAALAQAEQSFRFGNKEQKLSTLAKWIQDYQIPVQEMFVRGENGEVFFNQQYLQQQQQAQQPQGITPQQVQQLVQQQVQQAQVAALWNSFVEAKDGSGNPQHPHATTLAKTIDGLLRAGLAPDIPSAYKAAMRMPEHEALFEAEQKQHREAEQAAKAKAAAEAAQRAKQAQVSTRSSAPPGTVVTADKTRKGLRATLEAAVATHLPEGGGRV